MAQGKRERFDFNYSLTMPQAMWDRFAQQQIDNERSRERSQINFDGDVSGSELLRSTPAPSAPAAMPPKARQMYNLEQMIQRR